MEHDSINQGAWTSIRANPLAFPLHNPPLRENKDRKSMTTMLPKPVIILSLASVTFVVGAAVAFVSRWSMLDRYERTINDELQCKQLREKIESLRSVAPTKRPVDYSQEQSLSRIRKGLASSGISDSSVSDIRINGEVAIPKTDYFREDTLVSLRRLDMSTLVQFIGSEESQEQGTICSSIDLRYVDTPTNTSDRSKQKVSSLDRWDAQLTLTHLVERTTPGLTKTPQKQR
jgi:hypothetical protein